MSAFSRELTPFLIQHEDIYGRLCFPPMFLHPIKNADEKKGSEMPVPV